jgi:hypothetical protein
MNGVLKREQAATKIQSLTRGHLARKAIQNQNQNQAATVIQTAFKKGRALKNQENTCPITYDRIEMDNSTLTRCGHVFNSEALLSWLQRSATCPSCRANIEPQPVNHMPTIEPSILTNVPSSMPTIAPSTIEPTSMPTNVPTSMPTIAPSTIEPTSMPTNVPTSMPTIAPSGPTSCQTNTTNEDQEFEQEINSHLLDFVSPNDISVEDWSNNFENYVTDMSNFGTSGDQITLIAAANHYNVTIIVHHIHHIHNNDRFEPSNGQSRGELHLAFNGGHYMQINDQNQITERGGQGNCQFAVIAAELNRLGLMPGGIKYNENGSMVSENTHMAIRRSIVDHIVNNQDDYIDFIALGE